MTTGSDHEVIQFELTTKKSELVESSLTSTYNISKADWINFTKSLQRDAIAVTNQIQQI